MKGAGEVGWGECVVLFGLEWAGIMGDWCEEH